MLAAIPLAGTLCAIAGAVDVIAYLLYDKIFIANMTGNTVLFAASVLTRDWWEAGLRISVVIAFLVGTFVARAGLRQLTAGRDRRMQFAALAIEFAVLIALAPAPHLHALGVGLLMLLAFALAVQNDVFSRIGPMKLNTSFISGDLERLGDAIADTGKSARRKEAGLRIAVFISTWIAYAIGALLGAFGAFHFAQKALWIPAGLVVIAAALVPRSAVRQV